MVEESSGHEGKGGKTASIRGIERLVPASSGKQRRVKKTGCKVTCGAFKVLAANADVNDKHLVPILV